MRIRLAIGIFGALVLGASAAHAQEGNKAVAEAMFDEGLRLFDHGQFAEACAKFEASEKIDPASGTMLNLARCNEKTGKTASAWAAYREVQALSRKEGNAHREAFAHAREVELQPQLSKITIVVPSPPPGVELRLDGVAVDPAEWQTPVPIDPGAHVIDVSAPGKVAQKKTLQVGAGENASFTAPPLDDAPAAAAQPTATPTKFASLEGDNPHAEPSSGLPAVRVVALVAGGVGVLGLGAGTVFGLSAISKADDAKPHCHAQTGCDSEGASLRSDAGTFADVSTIAFIAGGVALGTGVVLWLTAPSHRAREAHTGLQVLPSVDPVHRSAGLFFSGAL